MLTICGVHRSRAARAIWLANELVWALWVATEVEPHAIEVLNHRQAKRPAERDVDAAEAAIRALRGPFGVLERSLAASGDIVSGRFTVADINTAEVFPYAMPASALLEAAPRVTAWLAACHTRPAFKQMVAARERGPA